jgi:hypothetical protein
MLVSLDVNSLSNYSLLHLAEQLHDCKHPCKLSHCIHVFPIVNRDSLFPPKCLESLLDPV